MPNYLESICPQSLSFLLGGCEEWKVRSRGSRTAWQLGSPRPCCGAQARGTRTPARHTQPPERQRLVTAEYMRVSDKWSSSGMHLSPNRGSWALGAILRGRHCKDYNVARACLLTANHRVFSSCPWLCYNLKSFPQKNKTKTVLTPCVLLVVHFCLSTIDDLSELMDPTPRDHPWQSCGLCCMLYGPLCFPWANTHLALL